MKLAKRRSTDIVKHTTAKLDTAGSKQPVSQFVAVQVVQRFATGRDRVETELLSAKESSSALLRQVEALRTLDHPNIQREITALEGPRSARIAFNECAQA